MNLRPRSDCSRFGRATARLTLVTLLGLAALAPPAHADGDDVAALLRRGFELRRQHRNEEALAAYDEAFALSPTPPVRAQRALAEQTLGHWIVAERELDLALATDDPWITRNRPSLEDARAVVRQHLAWLTVDVDVQDADIRLDGEPLPQGTAARVIAGAGVLEVRAPGCIPDIRRVFLAPSEHVRQQISLGSLVAPMLPPPVAPAAVPPPPGAGAIEATPEHAPVLTSSVVPPPKERSAVPVVPIALGVAGIAGLATGTYFGVRTGQDKSNERAECVGGCTQAAANDYSDAQRSAAVSTAAFATGAACIAGGAIFWLLERGAPRGGKSSLDLVPAFGAGMNGLVLRGRL